MGLKRSCILRELKHFDVGQSFVVDSLHNIYHGVFVSFSENLHLISFVCLEAPIKTVAQPIVRIRTMECIYKAVRFGCCP